ncbi:MAG TPA: hypothetical protein V6D20_21875, partial [Candidatus Obscuribacterales bacterium]
MKRPDRSQTPGLLPSLALALLLSVTATVFPQTQSGAIAQTAEQPTDLDQRLADIDRTTTLFNAMLIVLALLLGSAIIGLWLLRRSVVREVTILVKDHLNDLTDLEDRITAAHKELRSLLKETEALSEELDEGVIGFQREVKQRREELQRLSTEVGRLKEKALDELDEHLEHFEKQTRSYEVELSTQLADVQKAIADDQAQSHSSLDQAEQAFATRLQELHKQAGQHQKQVIDRLTHLEQDFVPQLDMVRERTEAQIQRQANLMIDNLSQVESGFTDQISSLVGRAQAEQTSIIANLKQQAAEFLSQFNGIQSEVQNQKTAVLQGLRKQEADFAAQFSGVQAEVQSRRDLVVTQLETATGEFRAQFDTLSSNIRQQADSILGNL